jgi:hypothetical protein
VVRRNAALNRTEDLNVKNSRSNHLRHRRRALLLEGPRPPAILMLKIRSWLQAVSHYRDAAITKRDDDCGDDESHRLAAALGARLSGRRRAQAPQAEARLQEGGRQPGLSDRGRGLP